MIKINRNKRIGSVIFVVEGKDDEPKLIRNVFKHILEYDIYQYNKQEDIIRLSKSNDIYNKVVIITNNKPQISCVLNETEFVNNAFNILSKNNLDIYNSAIYYIFDRDYKSNSKENIERIMKKLSSSRDNDDFEMNGLFLISYPCIQAFYMNGNRDYTKFLSSNKLKTYVNINKYKKIDESKLIIVAKEFFKIIKKDFSIEWKESYLDDFKNINIEILNKEESHYLENNSFITLSLFIISLIDLGIIEITD